MMPNKSQNQWEESPIEAMFYTFVPGSFILKTRKECRENNLSKEEEKWQIHRAGYGELIRAGIYGTLATAIFS